jgi:hypothetical protein
MGKRDKILDPLKSATASMTLCVGVATVALPMAASAQDHGGGKGNVTATVLVKQADGSYLPTEVNIYDAVFASKNHSGTGTFSAFATAADDARAVINYIHEYAVPADTVAVRSN